MAFIYRFASLLRLALHEENQVKSRLAIKDGQIAAEEAKIKKIVDEREGAFIEQARDLTSGNMERVRMYPLYLRRLQKSQDFFEEELQRLRLQREKILVELSAKRRARMIFEKLRERDEKRYKKLELKQDQKRMDEFAARAGKRSATQEGRQDKD
ncbi:MAG: flagellar export protein FliJ [Candidatus Ozemobacteraceae bacterium]